MALRAYSVMPSSVIRNFVYDRASATLEVTFTTGRRYRYFLVPAHVAEGMSEAFSKGRYFNARVRDRFPFAELAEAEPEVTSPRKGSRRHP